MKSLWQRFTDALDPDAVLQQVMQGFIDASANRYAMGREGDRWEPGKPLRLLLAGYNGTRNTGADVRVEEMIRQLRHLIGDDQLEMALLTNNSKLTAGYFRTVKQLELPQVYPKFLYETCTDYHGVVACEGSMFKSKFADALTTMMAGSLGMAAVEGKLSVGYGAEAGAMSPHLTRFVEKACRDSLVICRNEPSRKVLSKLGVRTTSGTDTGWTFTPAPRARGEQLLRDVGWDGKKPLLAICAIHPFWWPVKPDLVKGALMQLTGEFRDDHYRSIYFHHHSRESDLALAHYLDGIAQAVNAFRQDRTCSPSWWAWRCSIATHASDWPGESKGERRSSSPTSTTCTTWFSVLRRCSMMVSSRYHAIVTSMPGLVPSAGITMDERIRNLMAERGHNDLFLEVDDDDLGERLLSVIRRLHNDAELIRGDIARVIPPYLKRMGRWGSCS